MYNSISFSANASNKSYNLNIGWTTYVIYLASRWIDCVVIHRPHNILVGVVSTHIPMYTITCVSRCPLGRQIHFIDNLIPCVCKKRGIGWMSGTYIRSWSHGKASTQIETKLYFLKIRRYIEWVLCIPTLHYIEMAIGTYIGTGDIWT
jgi:hypothetical protein